MIHPASLFVYVKINLSSGSFCDKALLFRILFSGVSAIFTMPMSQSMSQLVPLDSAGRLQLWSMVVLEDNGRGPGSVVF